LQLIVNPSLDCGLATSLHFFPFVIACGLVALNNTDIPYLGSAPTVALIVEAIEDFPWHGESFVGSCESAEEIQLAAP
jgi:hypothetical protein